MTLDVTRLLALSVLCAAKKKRVVHFAKESSKVETKYF